MEIAPGIHRIDTPLGERINTLWLVDGDDSAVLFDVGVKGALPEHVLPYLAGAGIAPSKVRWVVVSHCDVDHYGGLGEAGLLPEAMTLAHAADAPAMSDFSVFEDVRGRSFRDLGMDEDPEVVDWCRSVVVDGVVDRPLEAGTGLDLGGRYVDVLHVPGHSKGHLALRVADAGVVLVSDAVLGSSVPFADGRPAFPPTYRHVDDYHRSIDELRALAPDAIGTAHYGVYAGEDAQGFLDESARFADTLEARVVEVVEGHRRLPLPQLLAEVNPVGEWPQQGALGALAFPVVGHLERLEALGSLRVSRPGDGEPAVVEAMR